MIKHLFQLVILLFLSCSSCNSNKLPNGNGKMQFGLYIENTPRQGSQYFDSEKREYNYRYYTITITNDSIVPVRLKINFDKTSVGLFNVFLITRRLTPEEYSMTDQHLLMELIGGVNRQHKVDRS